MQEQQEQERRALVTRLREIIRASFPVPAVQERAFEARSRLASSYPYRRHQAIREINRLSDRWGWRREVDYVLAETGANGLKSLDADQLEALLARLRAFEDALQTAADPPDCPPAR